MIGSASSALVTAVSVPGVSVSVTGVGPYLPVLESPPRWLESLRWQPGFVRLAQRPQTGGETVPRGSPRHYPPGDRLAFRLTSGPKRGVVELWTQM